MPKTKYHFNFKTLSFEEMSVSIRKKLIKFFSIFTSGMVISAAIMLVIYSFIDSPKEKVLKRENEQYQLQLQILNNRISQVGGVLDDIQNRDDNIYRTIFEADPIPNSVRKAGYGGEDRYAKFNGYDNAELLKSSAKKLDIISRQLYIQSKSFDEIVKMAKNKEEMLACMPAIQPTSKTKSTLISGYGYRVHPIYKTLRMHTGIDFAAKKGTPIYATGDGKVIALKGGSGYGLVVVIDHGYGFQSLYGHMSKMVVKPGEKVKRGQVIGYVGSSGLSVAPHCHYEILKNGKRIDPIHYFYNDLTPDEYQKVIEQASKQNQSLS